MKKNLLNIEDFNMAFGDNVLFTNFNYKFEPGIYAFAGPSGVGKSTLMRIIAGLEKRYTGDITLNGKKITSYCPEVHMVHQHYASFPWLNVLKNTLMVYKGHKIKPTDEDVEEAKKVIERLGLGEHMYKLPSQISGGQDQRLSLASAFINRWSNVILYDEPTSALDNDNDMLIVDMIREHQEKYGTIEIIITHEEHVVKGLGATVLELTPEFRLRPKKEKVSQKSEETSDVKSKVPQEVEETSGKEIEAEVTTAIPVHEEGVNENEGKADEAGS